MSHNLTQASSSGGGRMPAEWEPHHGTLLAWPDNAETWPGQLEAVQQVWIDMVDWLSRGEWVYLLVRDEVTRDAVRTRLEKHGARMDRIHLWLRPYHDSWMRDAGPIFVRRGSGSEASLLAHDFRFNNWGKKYPGWELDDTIAGWFAAQLGVEVLSHDFVLEGGSIEVNGRGTLLTTESCLLHPNRNPQCSRAQIEARLKEALGVDQVLWLGEGVAGDDTDGHIDDLTRFVAPDTIVTVVEKDPSDPNAATLQENLRRLGEARDPQGKPFRVIELPMPPALEGPLGRAPASYANFYIANVVVLVPVFQGPHDDAVLETLRPFFPGREVIGIDCRHVVGGLGAFHCVTQQIPATAALPAPADD